MLSPFTTDPLALTRQRLAQAETAYHNIQTGKMAKVLVDQNGERIEYQSANLTKLMLYIDQLKAQLGLGGAVAGPMRVFL